MHDCCWSNDCSVNVQQPIKLPFVRDFKFLKEKEWGPLIPGDLQRMGLQDQCKLISRILSEQLPDIRDCQVVPSARCPIVRFKYEGNIKCDLSLNNKWVTTWIPALFPWQFDESRHPITSSDMLNTFLKMKTIIKWKKVKVLSKNADYTFKIFNSEIKFYCSVENTIMYIRHVHKKIIKHQQISGDVNIFIGTHGITCWPYITKRFVFFWCLMLNKQIYSHSFSTYKIFDELLYLFRLKLNVLFLSVKYILHWLIYLFWHQSSTRVFLVVLRCGGLIHQDS